MKVYACQCPLPEPPEEALKKATAVFSGKVTDRIIGQHLEFTFSYPFIHRMYEFEAKFAFTVSEIWKGDPYETMIVNTISSGAMCGLELGVGEEAIVYAYGETDYLSSDFCTRTRPLADASEDLAILGKGTPPTIAGANEPDPPNMLGWTVGSCTAVFLLAVTVLLLLKRRRQSDGAS